MIWLAIATIAGLAWLAVEVACAPVGYEDDGGWHPGIRPSNHGEG